MSEIGDDAIKIQNEARALSEDINRHFVRTEDLHSLRDEMRLIAGTKGDGRDTVLRLESRMYPEHPSKLPPARREKRRELTARAKMVSPGVV